MRTHSIAYLGTFVLGLLGVGLQDAGVAVAPAKLEVTYLANEGVMLERGDTKVVIDGFVFEPFSIYASVPASAQKSFGKGEEPFDAIDLALTSHVHGDHFQAAAAYSVLRGNSKLLFSSSPQVIEALQEELPASDAVRERVSSFLPEVGKWREIRKAGVRVESFQIPHSGNRPTIQNLAHLVDVDGMRILHLGDADANEAFLKPFGLKKREVDVLFVPYWWLQREEGRRLVRDVISPRFTVAVHVPTKEVEALQKMLKDVMPEAFVFGKPLETRSFEPVKR